MSKGKKTTKPSADGGSRFFHGKEVYQRMNFLYQASHVALTQSHMNGDLPVYYGRSVISLAQKSVLKIEPEVKRGLCKGCCNVLVPGITVRHRIRPGRLIYTCLVCGTIKRIPTKRGYKIWIERKEACIETIEVPNDSNNLGNRKVHCDTGIEQQIVQSKSETDVDKRTSSVTKCVC